MRVCLYASLTPFENTKNICLDCFVHKLRFFYIKKIANSSSSDTKSTGAESQSLTFGQLWASQTITQGNMMDDCIWSSLNQEIMQSCKIDQNEENLEIFSKLKSCSSAQLLKVVIFDPSVHWFYSRHVLKDGIIYSNIEEGINLKWHKDWKI